VSKTWNSTMVALALLLAVLAAACGGESGTGSTSSEATTLAANKRFTDAQWQQYQSDNASFKKVNDTALTKISVCTKPINPPPGTVEKCVGDSLTNLSSATKQLDQTLKGLTGSVSGKCLTALTGLLSYVTPYEASIAALQNTIDTKNFAAAYNSVTTMTSTSANGQKANAVVKRDCAPV
jgi:hypothetical protein